MCFLQTKHLVAQEKNITQSSKLEINFKLLIKSSNSTPPPKFSWFTTLNRLKFLMFSPIKKTNKTRPVHQPFLSIHLYMDIYESQILSLSGMDKKVIVNNASGKCNRTAILDYCLNQCSFISKKTWWTCQ